MQRWNGKSLKIGELVAETPIVQGGMGIGISLSGLASAVANEGGIGVISAAGIGMDEPDFGTDYISANNRALRKIIRKARELTNGIIGVNIMVAARNFDELAKSAIEEGIDIIFAGAGLPLNLPSLKDASSKTKLIPIISSVTSIITFQMALCLKARWLEAISDFQTIRSKMLNSALKNLSSQW